MSLNRTEHSISDESLLRRLSQGDGEAAYSLYLRYAAPLLRLARQKFGADLGERVDPEDIVQSVFRTFFRRASAGKYNVPEGGDLWRLLLVIALNKIRNEAEFQRAAKRDVRRTGTLHEDTAEVDDAVAFNVLQLSIDELTQSMPVANQRIVRMRIEGHSLAEIAAEVGRSKRTVERVLQDFRSRLMRTLRDEDESPGATEA
ncbi:MAG: sigma-70 family RNA polymerase sigma factor [Planctomycetota bacterium]|nr:MAG: sigma-70 family RNA polymerase sigma factor [Planctomycetota bacterium]